MERSNPRTDEIFCKFPLRKAQFHVGLDSLVATKGDGTEDGTAARRGVFSIGQGLRAVLLRIDTSE